MSAPFFEQQLPHPDEQTQPTVVIVDLRGTLDDLGGDTVFAAAERIGCSVVEAQAAAEQ